LDLHHQIGTLSLVEAAQKRGVTVVTTMHDITLGAMFSSKFILLAKGEIAIEGSATQVVHSSVFKSVFDHKLSVFNLEGEQPIVIARRDYQGE
jgi:iron complex transport system ATP-binding protein